MRQFRPSLRATASVVSLVMIAAILTAASVPAGFGTQPFAAAGVPAGADTSKLYHAYVVMQAGDCTSNLEFLQIFDRPELRERFGVSGLVVESSVDEARALLAERQIRLPVKRMRSSLASQSRLLGYRKTPFIVVINKGGVVRYTAPAPPDPIAQTRLAEMLMMVSAPPPVRGASR